MDRNYQKELEQLIAGLQSENQKKKLLLHSCCAPCSSYVLAYLKQYFDITVFYYNPNIMPEEEYQKRLSEQKRLLQEAYAEVQFIEGHYEPAVFHKMARGLEQEPEGGARCFRCYELRLRETARLAKENGYDYFATTLSISPHKNATKLNEIGERVGAENGIPHLPSDFKKKEGYKQSIELSKKYHLYRQIYCGCQPTSS
ncbi:MAG: epoxyqueuosine reductase QueH [bacterium]|nr:epoxyqueuosine reductase QueH [bacterium]